MEVGGGVQEEGGGEYQARAAGLLQARGQPSHSRSLEHLQEVQVVQEVQIINTLGAGEAGFDTAFPPAFHLPNLWPPLLRPS